MWTDLPSEEAFAKLSVRFDCEGEGDVIVMRKCPECGRIIGKGEVWENGLGEVTLKNWKCKTHDEVKPWWIRD